MYHNKDSIKREWSNVRKLCTGIFTAFIIGFSSHLLAEEATCNATLSVSTINGTAGQSCTPLLAGQNINVGSVCTEIQDSSLIVNYNVTAPEWSLSEAHLWVGQALVNLPVNNAGNPIPGKFPYKAEDLTGTSYSFTVPLGSVGVLEPCDYCGANAQSLPTLHVAAHAVVVKKSADGSITQTETGWGSGPRITDKGNWGTYFSVGLAVNCDNSIGNQSCETAFAYPPNGSNCFLNSTLGNFSRWGWSLGPIAPSATAQTYDIYAAAGQCDITKGTKVGTLTVLYNNGVATITYTMSSGYKMSEAHLYAGSTALPLVKQGKNLVYTVAPGQYPNIRSYANGASSDIFQITGLTGNIYVVAHAVVCGSYPVKSN